MSSRVLSAVQYSAVHRIGVGRSLLPVLVLGLLATTGCKRREAPLGATVFDSAGIRVIELGPGIDAELNRRVVASEPDLVIRFDEDDAAAVVAGVTDVELLSQDRIAVADEGGNAILVFDSAGHHIVTWGGIGDGPGEFGRLEWFAYRPPDSLAAGDARLRRVTVFDANGEFVRSFRAPSAGSSPLVPPRLLGLLGDGSAVGAFFESIASGAEGEVRPEVEVLVVAPTGDRVHSVGTWPGDELVLFSQEGSLQVVAPPFGRRLHISAGNDRVWIGDDARWEVRGYAADARLRTIVRASISAEAVSDNLIEQRITEKYRGRLSEGPALEELKRDQRSIAHHATTPSFGMLLGMEEGGVAIGEYRANSAGHRAWFMVDSTGGVTVIDLPAALDVKRLGPDWVIGVVRDEFDREEIHRYAILDQAVQIR